MSSSSDGSWLFPDGSLSFEEIIKLKDDFGQSDKRKLFIVLDSNNQNAFLQKVMGLDISNRLLSSAIAFG